MLVIDFLCTNGASQSCRKKMPSTLHQLQPTASTFIHQSNARLYKNAEIQRIDRVLVDQNTKFFQKLDMTEMPFFNDDPEQMKIAEFKPPWYLEYMRSKGRTHQGNSLTHYHQRYRPNANNAAHLVYNIRQ